MSLAASTLSTIESINATIKNDKFTRLWFLKLLSKRNVKIFLLNDLYHQTNYRRLEILLYFHFLFYSATLALLFVYIYRHDIFYLFFSIFLLIIYWFIKNAIVKLIILLGLNLIKKDFSIEKFETKTLFQISEFYSKKFKIISLVGLISGLDQYFRLIFWGNIFIWLFMLPTNIWKPWALYLIIIAVFLYFLPFHFVKYSKN